MLYWIAAKLMSIVIVLCSERNLMFLSVQILTGPRRGKIFRLVPAKEWSDNYPYVLESEAISLTLSSDIDLRSVKLLFSGVEYEFIPEGLKENKYTYILEPRKENNQYQRLFQNYFGLTNPIVSSSAHIVEFSPVEVLAKKVTADQMSFMLDVVLSENIDLHSMFSPTGLSSSFSAGGEPYFVFEKLSMLFDKIDELLEFIYRKPITILSGENKIVSGTPAIEFGESGIAWLSENLSVLHETSNSDDFHLNYKGRNYIAKELQVHVVRENTDVYENRIIHGFFQNIHRYLNDLIKNIGFSERFSGNEHDGYISLFSVLNNITKKSIGIDERDIDRLMYKVKFYTSRAKNLIPVTYIEEGTPVTTQKAKANRFYASLFRLISEWYSHNKINWSKKNFLLSIHNIPKLFEYYNLILMRRCLESICNAVEKNNNAYFYEGIYAGLPLRLKYEPVFWVNKHANQEGEVINSEVKQLKNAMRHSPPNKTSNHMYSKRSPDFVIELGVYGQEKLIVFDAKYSNISTSFKRYLPECTMKYFHGISRKNGANPVVSMVILCPYDIDTFADFHSPPVGLFDSHTVTPILGVQGLSIGQNKPEELSSISLNQTLKRIIELTRNNILSDQKLNSVSDSFNGRMEYSHNAGLKKVM